MKKIRKDMEYLKHMTKKINLMDASTTLYLMTEKQSVHSFQAYLGHLQKLITYWAINWILSISETAVRQTTFLIHNAINEDISSKKIKRNHYMVEKKYIYK